MFTDAAPVCKTGALPVIALCVPTFRRNDLLRDCLASLSALRIPAGSRIVQIVADNDADAGARRVCGELGGKLPWPVQYVVEPRRGLAAVRNRLLEEALRHGAEWIAFLDDDERPDPAWLERHLDSLRRFNAAVSTGPVVQPETPGSAERLARSGRETGAVPRHVACNNVVFHAKLAADQGLRFDPRFDFLGGEDFDFFDASARAGNAHVWNAEALVYETVPPERATSRYLFLRHFSGAINSVVRYRKEHSAASAWLHFGLKSIGKLFGACVALLSWPVRGRVALHESVKRAANAAGYLSALANVRVERYR